MFGSSYNKVLPSSFHTNKPLLCHLQDLPLSVAWLRVHSVGHNHFLVLLRCALLSLSYHLSCCPTSAPFLLPLSFRLHHAAMVASKSLANLTCYTIIAYCGKINEQIN